MLLLVKSLEYSIIIIIMKNTFKYHLIGLSLLAPTFAFAALQGIKDLLGSFKTILQLIQPIVIGLAFVYFFWGMGQFILKDAGNEKSREEGKKKMLWGIIALFVVISIWPILGFISRTLGIGPIAPIPQVTF